MSRTPYEQFTKPRTTIGRNIADTLEKRTKAKRPKTTKPQTNKRAPPVRRRR